MTLRHNIDEGGLILRTDGPSVVTSGLVNAKQIKAVTTAGVAQPFLEIQ